MGQTRKKAAQERSAQAHGKRVHPHTFAPHHLEVPPELEKPPRCRVGEPPDVGAHHPDRGGLESHAQHDPVVEAGQVGNREHEPPAGPEHPVDLLHGTEDLLQVLEDLIADHYVHLPVAHGNGVVFDVHQESIHTPLPGRLQGLPEEVHSQDPLSPKGVGEAAGGMAVPAPHVQEDRRPSLPLPGTDHAREECLDPLVDPLKYLLASHGGEPIPGSGVEQAILMHPASPSPMHRSDRERKAYDEDGVWEASDRVHRRFLHVFRGPNTRRSEALVERILAGRLSGARVLEIGCGDGGHAADLLSHDPAFVLGTEVSETFLEEARRRQRPGLLEFRGHDADERMEGRYDVILGTAILHHLDFRSVLPRLYRENLAPGGLMVFREPLGSNLLMRLWWAMGKSAHTPDEQPLFRDDLRWLGREFHRVEVHGVNYLSFPAGILSSLVFRSPDNVLMRTADRVDQGLARALPGLQYRFRQAVIVIGKEAG